MKEKMSYVISWIFGIIFFLTALLNISTQPALGLALLLNGFILLPPVNIAIDKKWKLHLTVRSKIIFLIILVTLGLLTLAGMCGWFYCTSTG